MIMGDGAVGKTSLVKYYLTGNFVTSYMLTVVMEPYVKYDTLEIKRRDKVGKYDVSCVIWDFGGQQRFAKTRPIFYKGLGCALLVFDISRVQSFHNIELWLNELRSVTDKDIPILLVGNKVDLKEEIEECISYEEGLQMVKKYNLAGYLETSAKSGTNVNETFQQILRLFIEKALSEREGPPKELEEVTTQWQKQQAEFLENSFKSLSAFLVEIKENKVKDFTQALRIAQILERRIDKIKNKEIAYNAIALLYRELSEYNREKEQYTLQTDYAFKSMDSFLKMDNKATNREIVDYVVNWFWENLFNLANIERWFKDFQKHTKLYDLCYREGEQLFHIALQVYDSLITKNVDELNLCRKSLKSAGNLFPEKKQLLELANNAVEQVSKTMPECRIIHYSFNPKELIYDHPVSLEVLTKNNSARERTFSIELDTTGFEFKSDNQKHLFKEYGLFEFVFPLGKVLETSKNKMEIYLRLLDGKKNTVSTDIISIPEVQVSAEPAQIVRIEIKNESTTIVLDKEATMVLDVRIHNPSVLPQKVRLDIDSPKFIMTPDKEFFQREIQPHKTEVEKLVLGIPENPGIYNILARLIDEENKIVPGTDTVISFKFEKSKKRIAIEFLQGVAAVGSKALKFI